MGPGTSLKSAEEENLFLLLEIETQYLGHPACSPSTISTELSWLSSNAYHKFIYIRKYLCACVFVCVCVCVYVYVCVCVCVYIYINII